MKEFPEPMMTISAEEHRQLVECRTLVKELYFNNVIIGNNKKWEIPFELRLRLDALFDMKDCPP